MTTASSTVLSTTKRSTLAALAAACLAAACGGGGGDAGVSPFGSGSGSGGLGTGSGTGSGTTTGGGTTTPPPPAPTPAPGGSTTGGGLSNVSTGTPNQRFMSMSVDKYNLNWALDGDKTSVTIFVADSAGNPVPEGTTVQFSTEGGQIQTSCRLSGAKAGSASISSCSVEFVTQNFRPLDGRVTLLAWLEGEEAFVDQNANGRFDAGETFYEGGQLFRDDNLNDAYDAGVDELIVSSGSQGSPGIGSTACNQPAGFPFTRGDTPLSVPNTCDGTWGRSIVRASVWLPVSDPRFLQAAAVGPGQLRVWTNYGTEDVAAPAGTKVEIKTTAPGGCTLSVAPAEVSNVQLLPSLHTIVREGSCPASVLVDVSFGIFKRSLTVPL
jgi:hypothetical protein